MKKLVIPGLILAATTAAALVAAGPAFAGDDGRTGPRSHACRDAHAALVKAVALVVLYNKDVYPLDVVPTVGQITPAFLGAVLLDPDLGGGARAEVQAAVAAFARVDKACTPPVVVTTTPAPTTAPTTAPTSTPTTTPTTTSSAGPTPTVVIPTPTVTPGPFTQIVTVPQGSVDTGGGPA